MLTVYNKYFRVKNKDVIYLRCSDSYKDNDPIFYLLLYLNNYSLCNVYSSNYFKKIA